MTTLTLDMMLDTIRRVKQMMPPPEPRVFVPDHLPVERYPVCKICIAHPWIVWLSKWLPISPWIWMDGEVTQQHAYRIGGDVYMPPAMYHAFKARQKTTARTYTNAIITNTVA